MQGARENHGPDCFFRSSHLHPVALAGNSLEEALDAM